MQRPEFGRAHLELFSEEMIPKWDLKEERGWMEESLGEGRWVGRKS